MDEKKRSDLAKEHEIKSWRDLTPLNSSLGTMLHNKTGSWRFIKPVFEEKTPACQNTCLTGNDIEDWIKRVRPDCKYKARALKLAFGHTAAACYKFCTNSQ